MLAQSPSAGPEMTAIASETEHRKVVTRARVHDFHARPVRFPHFADKRTPR